jgi:hypothetical protein
MVMSFSGLSIEAGGIFYFPMYCIQHCFICRPSDSPVSEDAGIDYCDFGIGGQTLKPPG